MVVGIIPIGFSNYTTRTRCEGLAGVVMGISPTVLCGVSMLNNPVESLWINLGKIQGSREVVAACYVLYVLVLIVFIFFGVRQNSYHCPASIFLDH